MQEILHAIHDSLRRLDLNLLFVFDALFRHRSVAAAAHELALSSSACSHALTRLRDALSDELFVRQANGMQPTMRAEQMAPGVREALQTLAGSIGEASHFDPSQSRQTFVLAATDFTGFALLPPLVAALEESAPNVCVRMVYSTHRESLEDLASGRVHFALGFSDEGTPVASGIGSLDCFADDYVVAMRQKHARIRKPLSLRQYLAERHVVVTPWHSEGSVVDAALQRLGLERDVALQLPSLLAAPFVVAATDHLITLPRRAALRLAGAVPLTIYPVPFDIPGYRMKILFHRRHAATNAMRWMREQMLRALGAVDSAVMEH